MKPTDEQVEAVEAAQGGHDIKVIAYAGTGKTTTLKMIANSQPNRQGLYLAFNKAIVTDVQSKFPASVQARTFHSLAYRAFGQGLRHKLSARLTGQHVASKLDISDWFVETETGDTRSISASQIGYYIVQCVGAYCRVDEPEITERVLPVPNIRGIGLEQKAALRRQAVSLTKRLWSLMSDVNDPFPATHDVYVKLWADSRPRITGYDYILFDEAQDADPIMTRVVEDQSVQKVWVGDPFQQIYSWRGAINAMARITAKPTYLTQSFRFGEAVADQANLLLRYLGAVKPLRGNPGRQSVVGPLTDPKAMLFRTNASVMAELLDQVGGGETGVAATGTAAAIAKIEAIDRLRRGQRAGGEFALFQNYSELAEYAESSAGGDVRPFVQIERVHGAYRVLEALRSAQNVPMASARRVLAVAHQAKGLEWESVQLGHDFQTPPTQAEIQSAKANGKEPPREPAEEEHRLLYVALTRGIHALDDRLIDYDGYKERLGIPIGEEVEATAAA